MSLNFIYQKKIFSNSTNPIYFTDKPNGEFKFLLFTG